MKGKRLQIVAAILCVLVIFMITPGAAPSDQPSTVDSGVLRQISSMLTEAQPLVDGVHDVIEWEIKDSADAQAAIDKGEYPEDTSVEARAQISDLKGYVTQLKALKTSADALPSTGSDNEKMTVAAAQYYFAQLVDSAENLESVFDYYMGVIDGLDPITNFDPPEITTGLYDYSLLAGQISMAVAQSQTNIGKLQPPRYISEAHQDLLRELEHFQSFSQDFSIAVQLNDPLRIASCNNRLDRLDLTIDKCLDNLQEDIDLEFTHTKSQLNGAVKTLHNELVSNIDLLLS